jgi:putative endonuclease
MYYVYILKSESRNGFRYVGFTTNLKNRLEDHNEGKSEFTRKYRPWRIETYLAFSCKAKALEFEAYLKTGSGWAWSLKRL